MSALRAVAEPAMERAPFAAVATDDQTAGAIAAWARARSNGQSEGAMLADMKALHRALQTAPTPELLIIDVAGLPDPVADMTALGGLCDEGTRVLVLGDRNDVALYRALLGMGVEDYLLKPVTDREIAAALTTPGPAPRAGRSAPSTTPVESLRGHVTAVIGARGGVGASTVASSLAWLFAAERKERTALVDLDLHLGTGALMLDVEPGRGFRGALENPDRMDGLFLERAMTRAADNLYLLGAEVSLSEAQDVRAEALEQLFARLCESHARVVVDVPRVAERFLQVLPHADATVIVTDHSLAGLRDAVRLNALAMEKAPKAQARIVTNRAHKQRGEDLDVGVLKKALDREIDEALPFEPRAAVRSAAKGKPLAAAMPGGRAARALRRLCVGLAGDAVPVPRWRRWASRS